MRSPPTTSRAAVSALERAKRRVLAAAAEHRFERLLLLPSLALPLTTLSLSLSLAGAESPTVILADAGVQTPVEAGHVAGATSTAVKAAATSFRDQMASPPQFCKKSDGESSSSSSSSSGVGRLAFSPLFSPSAIGCTPAKVRAGEAGEGPKYTWGGDDADILREIVGAEGPEEEQEQQEVQEKQDEVQEKDEEQVEDAKEALDDCAEGAEGAEEWEEGESPRRSTA